ncbi:MAG: hypothetical protein RR505_06660 [Raoultibacter sp.]
MKKIISILMLAILCLSLTAVAGAEGLLRGTSLPTSTTTGSYSGTFNSLGESPLYYTNKNVKPSSSAMSMWVTGKMNAAGATSDYYSGDGLKGNANELGRTRLYNFSDVQSSRNANYSNSFSTSSYYWASFKLENRNFKAQLVGSFTFKSN